MHCGEQKVVGSKAWVRYNGIVSSESLSMINAIWAGVGRSNQLSMSPSPVKQINDKSDAEWQQDMQRKRVRWSIMYWLNPTSFIMLDISYSYPFSQQDNFPIPKDSFLLVKFIWATNSLQFTGHVLDFSWIISSSSTTKKYMLCWVVTVTKNVRTRN